MSEPSVDLVQRLRAGSPAAEQALFDRYVNRLLAFARSRLSPKLSRRLDPEDIVQSAYRSFFVRARSGEYVIERSGDLWRLLAAITINKLRTQVEHHQAAKRAIDREAANDGPNDASAVDFLSREPGQDDLLAMAEELEWLMSQVHPAARHALELRLQDHTIDEIASRLGRAERTVRRWLQAGQELLERRWSDMRE